MNASTAILGRMGIFSMTVALAVATLSAPASAAVKIKASAGGRILTIVGDSADNDVAVAVTPEADAIAVSADGQILGGFLAGSVESIRIRLGGGNDSLSLDLASQGKLGLRTLTVDLGAGDDYATVAVDPAVIRTVSGGAGEDTVSGPGSTADFHSVEHVVSWTALVSGGGGTVSYECKTDVDGTRYCVCDAASDWDCWNMFVDKCDLSSQTADDLSRCLKGSVTTHCTCKARAATAGGTFPILRIPSTGLVFGRN